MITRNQKLILIGNFVLKAKSHLGAIRLSEMLNIDQYAFDILVKAILTGDNELIEISKKVSHESNIGFNVISAVNSYVQNIQEINDRKEFLVQTKSVLIRFANQLYGIKINGATYRQAVERLLLKVDSIERTFSINLARKFYPYCGGISRNIAERQIDEPLNFTERKNALLKLWDNLDNEFFYDMEISTLGLYVDFMRENHYSENDIYISEKIAKIVTLEIRNLQSNQENTFRNAIDNTQILFENDDLKKLFIIVSREYYNFWLGNISKIKRDMNLIQSNQCS